MERRMENPSVHRDNTGKSILYLSIGVFILTIQDVIIKWISGSYPVQEIVLIRSVIAMIPILAMAGRKHRWHLLKTRRVKGHMLRGGFMFSSYLSFYLSLTALPLAVTVSLFFASPVFITMLSPYLLGDKVGIARWMAVFTGFAGVLVMLKPGAGMIDPAALLGVLSAFFYALGTIMTRRLGTTEEGITLTFYLTLMYILCALVFTGLITRVTAFGGTHASAEFLFREWQFPTTSDLPFFLSIGLISATAFYLLSQAYRMAPPSKISLFEYIAVPLSVLWGFILWQDVLTPGTVIGMVMIIGSGVYIFRRENR